MEGTSIKAVISLVLLVTLLEGLGVSPVQAAEPVPSGGPTDPGEMEAFLDELISQQLDEYHIPGAAVAVVKDGELFFAKGYGYANLEKRVPVVADQTLFRIGSTSKLFTWTAVMQLAEQGKLDLNADINDYLKDFQIPATLQQARGGIYPQPITMLHLMSHTAGFEEKGMNLWASRAEDMIPLRDFLVRYMPARVRPPGELTAYSNYGVALAGYIVAEISSMPFEQYVEENIFKPLQMTHSTFRQPVPADPSAALTMAYDYDGSFRAQPFEYVNPYPAGSMSTTVTDVAKFMIAHLQDGRYGEVRILQAPTVQQMHQRLFANDPRLSGFAYGFFDKELNHQRVLEHGGSTRYCHGLLALLPERNLGVYVVYNSAGGWSIPPKTLQSFLDRYYPHPETPAPQPPADFAGRAGRFTGTYRMTRVNYTSLERIHYLGGLGFGKISANPDGTLTFNAWGRNSTENYVEVEPLVFQSVSGQEFLIFREDGQGHITHLLLGNSPHYAWEKVAWYEVPSNSQMLLGICLVVFLSALVAGALGIMVNKRKAFGQNSRALAPRMARGLAFGISATNVLFVIGVMLFLRNGGTQYGIPLYFMVFLGTALGAAILTTGLVIFATLAWRGEYWSLAGRVHYTLVTLAAVVFVWLLNYWNLLGFRY